MEAILTANPPIAQKLERHYALAILLYCLANFFFPQLEKIFFWGEICVFFTALLLMTKSFSAQNYQRPILLLMTIWIFLMPIYGLLISKLYWPDVFEFQYLYRHAVFFYYSIFFFFAYHYAYLILFYLKKWAFFLILWVPFAILVLGTGHAGTDPIYGITLMALSQRQKKPTLYFLGYLLFLLILFSSAGSGTNKYIFVLYLLFPLLCFFTRHWRKWFPSQINRLLCYALVGIGIIAFFKFMLFFHDLTTQMALLGNSIGALQKMSEEYLTDLGGFWRLTLWSHLYGRLLEFPLGLGIGTPLFSSWLDGFVALNLHRPEENFIQGAHNSFITFIARLGLPALILFGSLFYCLLRLTSKVFNKLAFRPFQTEAGRLLSGALLGLASTCFSASFNVILESPLTAGNFWFTLGLFLRLFGDFLAPKPWKLS